MSPAPTPGAPVSSHLKRTFGTGLVFLVPVAVTAWVLWALFGAIDGFLGPLIAHWVGFRIPGLGILATVLLVYAIGLIASNVAGQRLIHVWDAAVTRVPLVRGLYRVTKEVSQAFQSDRRPFRKVVAVEFPGRGCGPSASSPPTSPQASRRPRDRSTSSSPPPRTPPAAG